MKVKAATIELSPQNLGPQRMTSFQTNRGESGSLNEPERARTSLTSQAERRRAERRRVEYPTSLGQAQLIQDWGHSAGGLFLASFQQ